MAELKPAAILVLGAHSLDTAQRIQAAVAGASVHGLEGRVSGAAHSFTNFGDSVRDLYRADTPIIALCAAGIVIRALAPLLQSKMAEPPVLCVSEDGSAVVPLLGAGRGANDMARRIAAAMGTRPAITTTGELRFGVNLLDPPAGYELLNPGDAKGFISDLLAGHTVRISGDAPWLVHSSLPLNPAGQKRIRITTGEYQPGKDELAYRYTPPRGRLAVVGLGPGDVAHRTPAVAEELRRAEDVLGYDTYVKMAGPFRADQNIHASDNREELDRARHAFDLAAQGRRVVLVSSGDPGVFAMAAAAMEALEASTDPKWRAVEFEVLPGISAAMAAAAKAGAPLGHDFCIVSLSDNLKPWSVIADRLDHAAKADFVLSLYNPISKARPHQLGEALAIVRQHRSPETPVILGRDVGRPAETLKVTTLGKLLPEQVDMRTVVIIGSSMTRVFPRDGGGEWVYTPRFYPPQG